MTPCRRLIAFASSILALPCYLVLSCLPAQWETARHRVRHSKSGRAATMQEFRLAVIPGDGIGKEVVPEGMRVLEAAGRRFNIRFVWDQFDWSCEYYRRHGHMMPEDGLDRIAGHDAIFLGAVGWPSIPDHISLWG